MQHGGELYTQLPRRVDGNTGLQGLTHRSSLYAGADTAPEGGVEQYDIDCRIAQVRRQLLEVDHHRVGGEPDRYSRTHLPHTVQSPGRILVIVVGEISNGTAKPDRFLHREGPVRVVTEGIARQRLRQCAVAREFVARWKYTALQFVGGE